MASTKHRLSSLEARLGVERLQGVNSSAHSAALLLQLFPEQRAFVTDAAKHKTAVCSRRAGKTVACGIALLHAAISKPGSVALYLTLSRINARRILWRTLLELNRDFKLGGEPSESELSVRFSNGSVVYLAGLADRSEVDKYRGLPLALVVVDEAQAVPPFLEELVDAVLTPALMDYNGSLALVGTPGPVPNSYFHECSKKWADHAWNVFQNPWIVKKSKYHPHEHLAAELKRKGVDETDPLIQREWFGRWIADPNSLVFRYDANRNRYEELPPAVRPYEFVLGVDLGWDDADAITVLGWSEDSPNLYLVEEWVGSKQTVTELGQRLQELERQYKPIGIVADTGGLGKKIAEEITKRTGLAIEAADKVRKLEHIELLNDALRTGKFFAKEKSRFAHDCRLVEWDKTNPEKPKISNRFHSDICDATLYAYRKAQHWLHTPAEAPYPLIGTQPWYERQKIEMEDQALEQLRQWKEQQEEL